MSILTRCDNKACSQTSLTHTGIWLRLYASPSSQIVPSECHFCSPICLKDWALATIHKPIGARKPFDERAYIASVLDGPQAINAVDPVGESDNDMTTRVSPSGS